MMMNKVDSFPYAQQAGWEAVEVRYDGEQLSMVLMLPATGLAQAEQSLTAPALEQLLGGLGGGEVALTLPKFKMESSFQLKEALSKLGMGSAFGGADFSGIDGGRSLQISDVIHKSFISVDEAGTEAAAATAVPMAGAVPGGPKSVSFDRPFLFVIRDLPTKAILFVGRVAEP